MYFISAYLYYSSYGSERQELETKGGNTEIVIRYLYLLHEDMPIAYTVLSIPGIADRAELIL